jgi:aminoglycoside phosphotransferase family enzyme
VASAESEALVAALLDPSAYEGSPAEVGLRETHISWLFFAGERVYKVKKPVAFSFLDFSTPALRQRYCEEEVRLNRRLTPWMYLGVVPIQRGEDGRVRVGGGGETIEHAVEMVRLPEHRMLSALLDRGEVDNLLITELAAHLARFHAQAPTGPGVDEHGSPEAVEALIRDNFAGLEPFAGETGAGSSAVVSPALFSRLQSRSLDFVVGNRELLERRVAEGRIRDGHGDLHAGNVCLAEQGIAIYDCLEFSERLRCSDVACDLAFLAMDLDLRGYSGFARFLARRYAREAGDPELRRLLPFYSAYRALVRAKVAAIAASQAGDRAPAEEKRREAMRYAHLAVSYELGPALIVVCGPQAAGKTWLARRVARPFHAALHSADIRRGPGAARPSSASREARPADLDAALADLEEGKSVVVDAAFATRESRRPFLDAAGRLGHPFYVLCVTAEDELIQARIAGRAELAGMAPPPDLATRRFEPPEEVPSGHVVDVRSERTVPEEACAALLEHRIARE